MVCSFLIYILLKIKYFTNYTTICLLSAYLKSFWTQVLFTEAVPGCGERWGGALAPSIDQQPQSEGYYQQSNESVTSQ